MARFWKPNHLRGPRTVENRSFALMALPMSYRQLLFVPEASLKDSKIDLKRRLRRSFRWLGKKSV